MAEMKELFRANHEQVLRGIDPAKPVALFSAGGTSGHINPALAVAQALAKAAPTLQILFLGRHEGLESELIPRAGFPLYYIEAGAFEMNLRYLVGASRAYLQTRREVKELTKKLDVRVVFGTGGYVSAPVMSAALSRKIPLVLHEQNAYPGKANLSVAKGAASVCISFESTREDFKGAKRVVLSGNPIAEHFFEDRRQEARDKLGVKGKQRYVLATGGSLGASSINRAVSELALLLERNPSSTPYKLHLITGKKHYQEVKEQLPSGQTSVILSDYVYDMPDQMAAADLVICRAGAGTCAELAAMGTASILVPYPYAKGDHQTKNAAALVDAGAAILVADAGLHGQGLRDILEELFQDEKKLAKMAVAAKALAKKDSADIIVREILTAMEDAR